MNSQNLIAVLGISCTLAIFLIGQLGVFIWWASRMNANLENLVSKVEDIQSGNKETILTIWTRFDELAKRVEGIERNCLVERVHHRKEDEANG